MSSTTSSDAQPVDEGNQKGGANAAVAAADATATTDPSASSEQPPTKQQQPQRPILGPGSKRPLMTHGKDGQVLSEKKLRRLEKNRLSARECRRRKREATENLERQINVLEGENLRLRLQLQVRCTFVCLFVLLFSCLCYIVKCYHELNFSKIFLYYVSFII